MASSSIDAKPASKPAKAGRLIELDILRGFLLLWMTLTHLPTKASMLSNQTFGFVSGAEGFIFLAGFMIGQLERRVEQKRGLAGTLRDTGKRALRVYLYHCALVAIAFTVVAQIAVRLHRLDLQNLLSFFLQSPKPAIIAAALLEYRPSLLDILPMYVVFLVLTPLAREIARRWTWDPVVYMSFTIWAAAQFGLRAWAYRHGDLFGLGVPENSTGSFDLYGWQLLWFVGLALGSINADVLDGSADPKKNAAERLPKWLIGLSAAIAVSFCILRYSPTGRWIDPNVYGWLIDKWHLGPARVINFSAIAVLLVRFGARLAAFPVFSPLILLGQASIEVFSVHVLCCLAGDALSRDADPNLPWWQQIPLLAFTLSALFLTGYARRVWAKKTAEKTLQR